MKPRLLFFITSISVLLLTGTLVAASQVSSQEPSVVQRSAAVTDAQPEAPAAPTSLLFSYQGQLLSASGNPITNPSTPMVFRLYTVVSGGTPCWSESRTVDVRNGVFSVLLGQTTAIDSACLAGDTYLELVVSGETLTPRERLTSVAHAVEASTMTSDAVTQGSLNISGNVVTAGSTTVPTLSGTAKWVLTGNKPQAASYGHNLTGAFGTTTQWDSDYMFTGLWDRGPNRKDAVIAWGDDPNDTLRFLQGIAAESTPREVMSWDTIEGLKVVGGLEVGLQDSGGGRLIVANNPNDNRIFIEAFSSDMSGHASELLLTGKWASPMPLLSLRADNTSISGNLGVYGNTTIHGNLDLRGSCTVASDTLDGNDAVSMVDEDCVAGSITSGAYVEANLMRSEERNSDGIERFQRGDLLCWSAANEQLDLCNTANDRLVMAVADPNGRPIVIGAEPVKVLGPVQTGDILVSSDAPGYAMVNNDPKPGTVIGQALESFDGEMGLIKAMVRKW
jgi:hypothetical protein